MQRTTTFCAFPVLCFLLGTIPLGAAEISVDFDRQILPLLSDKCFKCHGPDQHQRKGDLRLDDRGAVLGKEHLIVPGDPESSEIYRRLISPDADERMPPPDAKRKLTTQEIDLIADWIRAGANWQEHWAFSAPRAKSLPSATSSSGHNPVDLLVQAERAARGLPGNEEAGRAALIRRVSLDLTGIPPTRDEVDSFLTDTTPNAYERVVDRLLASPRYGERMASPWLDAARYADTSGYQNDGPRQMWRWRDWVIDAYNAGKSFDEFTLEQIAGDLLPDPALDQLIATGFNRNHRGNSEGGIIPEEYQVEYVVDRVETTSTVWLALTMGCARCHDHKFDPFQQREFFQIYAFFNNIPEHGRAIKEGNSPPYVAAPTASQRSALQLLEQQLAEAESTFASEFRRLNEDQLVVSAGDERPTILHSLVRRFPLETNAGSHSAGSHSAGSHSAGSHSAGSPSDDPVWRNGEGKHVNGRIQGGIALDGLRFLDAGNVGNFGYLDRFTLMAWIRPQAGGTVLSKMTDVRQGDGYCVQIVDGRVHVNLVKRWLDDSIRIRSVERVPAERWSHLAVTYDGSRVAAGIQIYLDGQPLETHVELDAINQSFAAASQPFRIGGGDGAAGRFRGDIDDVRIYSDCLSPADVAIAAVAEMPEMIAEEKSDQRTAIRQQKLERHFLEYSATGLLGESFRRLREIKAELAALKESIPTVMIMTERPERRETYVLSRGQYNQPREKVAPDVPKRLPSMKKSGATPNRLDLAEWIVSESNPLTARVAVNRYWQMFFGRGLVATTEDFGVQGARPSHPDLLDWLAVEFQRNWDVKAMMRMLATSSTYRQSSRITGRTEQLDPDNRFLTRGPRQRLSAQIVRDQALAASGLLVERVGGPSVRPYQPADLWRDIASNTDYSQSKGGDLYRRSLYTYWKRTISPPAMAAFDASTRDTCQVRIEKTNTPLQALTLLNDVTFVEAARVLAGRAVAEEASVDGRLRLLFRSLLIRQPRAEELAILQAGLEAHRQQFRAKSEAATKLLQFGDSPPPTDDSAETAAYTAVASMIMNLDEAVMNQ